TVGVGADGRLEISPCKIERSVAADRDIDATFAQPPRRGGNRCARTRLLRGGHAIFEIELNAIGAVGVRFVDVSFDICRYVQQRSPHRHLSVHSVCPLARSGSPSCATPAASSSA